VKSSVLAFFLIALLLSAQAPAQPANLTHLYTFNTDTSDSIGGANGVLQGNAAVTNGTLLLDGVNSYLALPANLISGYNAITIEAWVTDSGSGGWSRIFDFGNNTSDYMFLSLPAGDGYLRGACTTNGGGANEQVIEWTGNRPAVGQNSQIVWTLDGPTHTGLLYVNGALVAANSNMTFTPAVIGNTANNWLGRSEYGGDPYFKGSIDEFRIYNTALSSNAVYQDYLGHLSPPVSAKVSVQGHDIVITYNATTNMWYWVEFEDAFTPLTWEYLGNAPVLATNSTMTCIDTNAAQGPQRYYRVLQLSSPPPPRNLALSGTPSTSYVSPWETLGAINDGYVPANSADHSHGGYGNWPTTGTNWVEYDWPLPVNTGMIDVYWWQDNAGVYAPASCSLQYWNGTAFVPVSNPSGLGVALNQYNVTTFTPITTTRMRLLFASDASGHSTGILQWRVYDAGGTANFPPVVAAGVDRDVVVAGNTYLNGTVQDDGRLYINPILTWSKGSGPGTATFSNANVLTTTAALSTPGNATLQLSAYDGQYTNTSTLNIAVAAPPPATHLLPVYVSPYTINSPLWTYRLNKTITNWIPHLYAECNDTNNTVGNINSFIQAGNKLANRSFTVPNADPWADAYTLNAVEAMCYALMYDAQGDPNVLAAQATFRTNLNYWIPIILSAQAPDGYLHTYCTLHNTTHWSNNTLHEGYVGGYFIEASLAHYLMTGRTNTTLYNAAKRLADCWYTNIYVGQKTWFDGHENMEQALVHLGRFMNEYEGPTSGNRYITLAKYLMDTRGTAAANAALGDGSTYDQSQSPIAQQYEIVGHGVRAEYLCSGIEDVAIETGNVDYQSAALSLFDNFVNKKYYVQGGAGSGETSEGFGNNYSLPNSSYCETCAGCGTLFFFQKMNMAYQDAKYADLMENVLYNQVLGSLDDQASNIFYPNPLNSGAARQPWTGVPCCYGNAARTLFELPTWIYARSADTVYVNQFIGSTVTVSNISSTSVQMIQNTAYPWTNTVSITVNPATPTTFTLKIHVPNRSMSALYTPSPPISGLTSLQLNGSPLSPVITNGYATITRTWTAGDTINLVLPMAIQRIKASGNVPADVGLVALQYGPLIYNVESVDQDITDYALNPSAALSTSWTNNFLGGLVLINGQWSNGSTFMAIPNYARLNRGGSTAVWFKDQ
jgi:DUF1680 family protein